LANDEAKFHGGIKGIMKLTTEALTDLTTVKELKH